MAPPAATSQLLHTTGQCRFDVNSSSSLLSCGAEGSVRLVSLSSSTGGGLEDNGQCVLDLPDCQLTSVTWLSSTQFALARDESGFDGCVDVYEMDSNNNDDDKSATLKHRVLKVSMGVHDMCRVGSEWLAVAAHTEPLRVIRMLKGSDNSNSTSPPQELKNQDGSVVGLAGSSSSSELCSIGQDGSLTVWRLNNENNHDAKWEVAYSKKNWCQRSAGTLFKPAFHATKPGLLAVPGRDELCVMQNGGNVVTGFYEPVDFASQVVTLCAFSLNRVFACSAGKLVVWSLLTGRVEYSFPLEDATPCCLHACSDERVLLMTDEGSLVQYDLAPPPQPQKQQQQQQHADFDEEDDDVVAPVSAARPRADSDDDGSVVVEMSLEKMKQEFASSPAPRSSGGGEAVVADRRQVQREIQLALAQYESERREREELDRQAAQSSRFLQPGSTRFAAAATEGGEDADRRFLCWNSTGSIFCRREQNAHVVGDEDDEDGASSSSSGEFQSVEIEFAESTTYRTVRFKDLDMFDLGSLSSTGAMFASSRKGVVYFRSFNADVYSHWKMQLQDDAGIAGVCCSDEFGAVCTKDGRLRVLRHSGLQEPVFVLESARVRTMCCSETELLVVYEQEGQGDNEQVSFQLFSVSQGVSLKHTGGRISTGGGGHAVMWAGFSDASFAGRVPVLFLRNGTLLALNPSGGLWTVLAVVCPAERQIQARRLWPISLSSHGLLCVPLRAERRQPSVVPRSTPQVFTVKLPLMGASLRSAENKNSFDYEQQSLLDLFVATGGGEEEEDAELRFDVLQLKAMLVALRAGQQARAFGLVQRMRQSKTIELAIQKAGETGLASGDFIDRMEALRVEREGAAAAAAAAAEEEEEVEEEERRPVAKRARQQQQAQEEEEEEEPGASPSPPPSPPRSATKPPTNTGGPPRNRFLISATPALRESPAKSSPGAASSPVVLNRQSSFASSAREEHRGGKRL